MALDFRTLAKQALSRARTELATVQSDRLRYAALELRFAMEAVTYDRALAFKSEIPPDEYKTWQPRKLMQVLHDIDPTIGMTSSIAAGIEEIYGVEPPPEKMRFLGTDKVFSLAELKEHYDAIGNYLHVPSLGQLLKSGMPDEAKLRVRCEAIIASLDEALSSPIWNATLGKFAEFECIRCKKRLRRRIPHDKAEVEAACFECHAQYVISSTKEQAASVKPKTSLIPCETEGCVETMPLWPDEVKTGTHWTCKGCGEHWGIEFGLVRISGAGGRSKSSQ